MLYNICDIVFVRTGKLLLCNLN